MIEINLIPEKFKKAKKAQFFVFIGVAVGGLVVLGMLGAVTWQAQRVARIEKQIKKIDAESASLKDKIEEVKKFNTLKKTFENKQKIVKGLLEEQSLWAKILDRISEILPPDMWLTEIAQQREKEEGIILNITGYSLSKALVADLIKRLEHSPEIMDLKAVKIMEEKLEGSSASTKVSMISFELNFLYKTDIYKGKTKK